MARKQVLRRDDHLGTIQGDTLICNLCEHHIETQLDRWRAPHDATGVVHTDQDTVEQMREHVAAAHPGREYGDWRQEQP